MQQGRGDGIEGLVNCLCEEEGHCVIKCGPEKAGKIGR
jgi:hypothetical protein